VCVCVCVCVCVVYVLQLGFKPGEETRAEVRECRKRLHPSLSMAVEFRSVSFACGNLIGLPPHHPQKGDLSKVTDPSHALVSAAGTGHG